MCKKVICFNMLIIRYSQSPIRTGDTYGTNIVFFLGGLMPSTPYVKPFETPHLRSYPKSPL